MKKGLFLLAAATLLAALPVFAQSQPSRERLSLDTGWRFHLGDIPFPVVKGHGASYNHAKAGAASGAAASAYDDSNWRAVTLPHDWAVEGPFDKEANISQGYRPRGFGWYRRSFKLDPSDKGKHLEIQFDGIATYATVWLNGTVVHRNFCGYTGFSIDLTPFAKYGDSPNVLAVRVDADEQEGWWYEGAGIYRHTWLVKRAPVHVATDGIFAQPVRQPGGQWTLPVQATLESSAKEPVSVTVEVSLIDAEGRPVAQGNVDAQVPALGQSVASLSIPVSIQPRLWSLENPVLYSVQTVVKQGAQAVDSVTTRCGFRTIRFDADKGFFLNDEPVKLMGTCNHQDHAGVGVALPDSLWEFRVRKLKEMGSNAYRCSHNPPAAELLEACDRQGMLVMDENRNFNCAPEQVRQLEWLVRRDRNHPSVILWSVFNEEPMQGTETGYEMVCRMSAVVKTLDTTRPVTAAMSGGHGSPLNVSHAVDVVGFNYCQNAYDGFHAKYPNKPLTSSEDTSAFMIRGEFVTDKSRNIIGSYDDQRAPWGATHRDGWKRIGERPFLAGGFVWTGFDYRGEPTPHSWPSAGSFFGCMDLCGFPKAAFYIHQAQWIKNRPVLKIQPHWNWAGKEGQPIQVMALTNAEAVELILNGKSLGEKPVDPYMMVSWDVPYAPGRLEAVAKKGGKIVTRDLVETTGAAVALRLTSDRPTLAGDGRDALPVTVEAIDAKGQTVPTANVMVEFELTGPGAIIGLGNGDPNCHEPEKGNQHSIFNGLAQVILQSKASAAGPLVLTAKAAGLKTATATVAVQSAPELPAVKIVLPVQHLDKWRMSTVSKTKLDPNVQIADSDMNTWSNVKPGKADKFNGGSWVVFRSDKFKAFENQIKTGGRIIFQSLAGKAEVWLDGKLVGTKSNEKPDSLTVELPPGAGEHVLSVLVETPEGKNGGFAGLVIVDGPK